MKEKFHSFMENKEHFYFLYPDFGTMKIKLNIYDKRERYTANI